MEEHSSDPAGAVLPSNPAMGGRAAAVREGRWPPCLCAQLLILCNIHLIAAAFYILCIFHLDALCRFYILMFFLHILCASRLYLM